MPIAAQPNGPALAKLVVNRKAALNEVTVIDEDEAGWSRIARPATGDLLVVGWVKQKQLGKPPARDTTFAAFGAGGFKAGGGGRRGRSTRRRSFACAKEIPLVAEVGSQRRTVGSIGGGVHLRTTRGRRGFRRRAVSRRRGVGGDAAQGHAPAGAARRRGRLPGVHRAMTSGGHRRRAACIRSVRLFTLDGGELRADTRRRDARSLRLFYSVSVACAFAAAGCGVKTVYLHDGKQQLDNVAVVVWSSPDPPADAPSIALAKIDDKKLAPHTAPVNRLEVLPGTHDFIMKASYPDPGGLGAHKPPAKAMKSEGPAKFSLKGVSLRRAPATWSRRICWATPGPSRSSATRARPTRASSSAAKR